MCLRGPQLSISLMGPFGPRPKELWGVFFWLPTGELLSVWYPFFPVTAGSVWYALLACYLRDCGEQDVVQR